MLPIRWVRPFALSCLVLTPGSGNVHLQHDCDEVGSHFGRRVVPGLPQLVRVFPSGLQRCKSRVPAAFVASRSRLVDTEASASSAGAKGGLSTTATVSTLSATADFRSHVCACAGMPAYRSGVRFCLPWPQCRFRSPDPGSCPRSRRRQRRRPGEREQPACAHRYPGRPSLRLAASAILRSQGAHLGCRRARRLCRFLGFRGNSGDGF